MTRFRSRRARIIMAAVLAAVLVPALGLTAAALRAPDVSRGTTVLGIDIGGKSRQDAAAALEAGLAQRAGELAATVTVHVGGPAPDGAGAAEAARDPAATAAPVPVRVDPTAVGLAVDIGATVEAAAARRSSLWAALPFAAGGGEVDPVVTVDADRLDDALRDAAGAAGADMVLPEIRYRGLTPVPVYPRPGLGLDPDQAVAAMTGGWLRAEVIRVPLVDIHPVTTAADVDRLIAELARPAVAGPVSVTTPRGTLTVPPEAIAASLLLTADEHGEIVPRVAPDQLHAALAEQLPQVETEPRAAHVATTGGQPRLVASSGGQVVDMAALATDLLRVLPEPPPRGLTATMTVIEPAVSSQELADLGIAEQVSTFTTYFDGGRQAPRSVNIIRAAEQVDGAIVRPGEVFSLNGHTGPRGYAEGYLDAPIIVDGKLVPGVGGGISQFTTTLFNAAYYAGLEDVHHQPHTYWFSRYPSVIEATIFYPSLDLKFRNNTPYGVLIDTSYTDNSITVSMWSTKVYDEVTTEWSAKRGIVKPETEYLEPGPSCIATEGIDGFTQDAWRIFVKDGKEVRREKFSWRYDAEPRFICGEKPQQ